MTNTNAYVYLVADPGRKLKVGYTWNLRLRLQQLTRRSRCQLELLAFVPFENDRTAICEERRLHAKYHAPAKRRGDWYPWRPDLVRSFAAEPRVVLCLGGRQ